MADTVKLDVNLNATVVMDKGEYERWVEEGSEDTELESSLQLEVTGGGDVHDAWICSVEMPTVIES